jgi:hypothetical protein
MTNPTETTPDADSERISTAVSLVLIDRYFTNLEARCDQQASLVADLKARGEDTRDAEAFLRELERGLMLLEATQARLRAEQEK